MLDQPGYRRGPQHRLQTFFPSKSFSAALSSIDAASQLLESAVFILQTFKPLRVRPFHSAVLGFPLVALDSRTAVYLDSEVWFEPFIDTYDRRGQLFRSHIYWLVNQIAPPPSWARIP